MSGSGPGRTLLRVYPLNRFFWTAKGVVANPNDPAVSKSGGVARYQEVEPQGVSPKPAHTCYVAEMAQAKVVGDVTFAATCDDIVIGDLQALHGVEKTAEHWSLKRTRFRAPKKLSGTAVLLAAASAGNYYHWLCESLPRLRLLELAGVELAGVDWFLLTERRPAFQDESLDLLGIPESKRHRCSRQHVLTVQRLIVPSMIGAAGAFPEWACEFLRQKFLGATRPRPERKIYISRQHARGRKLVNESAVIPWLKERGFEIVCLERLKFGEQVKLFASARTVVGVHGAGMANLVFGSAGCSVLEFFSPEYLQECYRELAAMLGMKYHSLVGDPAPRPTKRGEEADVYLDLDRFRAEIEAAEARAAAT